MSPLEGIFPMHKRLLTVCLAAMLIFIWGNSLLSGELSARISDRIMLKMNAAVERAGLGKDVFTVMKDQDGDGVKEPTSFLIRKAAHITEFALFAALLWLRLAGAGKKQLPAAFFGSVAVAAIDETLQIFSHRGPSVEDVLIDACGAAMGVAAILALTAWRKKRIVKSRDSV